MLQQLNVVSDDAGFYGGNERLKFAQGGITEETQTHCSSHWTASRTNVWPGNTETISHAPFQGYLTLPLKRGRV